jgi:hypothetical protein
VLFQATLHIVNFLRSYTHKVVGFEAGMDRFRLTPLAPPRLRLSSCSIPYRHPTTDPNFAPVPSTFLQGARRELYRTQFQIRLYRASCPRPRAYQADDISGAASYDMEANYQSTDFKRSTLEEDWVLQVGTSHSDSESDGEFRLKAGGSIDAGNLNGSISFGAISISESKMVRDDAYNVQTKLWESVGEKSESNVSSGGSSIMMAGIESMSVGPASINVSITINGGGRNKSGKSKVEQLRLRDTEAGSSTNSNTSSQAGVDRYIFIV